MRPSSLHLINIHFLKYLYLCRILLFLLLVAHYSFITLHVCQCAVRGPTSATNPEVYSAWDPILAFLESLPYFAEQTVAVRGEK